MCFDLFHKRSEIVWTSLGYHSHHQSLTCIWICHHRRHHPPPPLPPVAGETEAVAVAASFLYCSYIFSSFDQTKEGKKENQNVHTSTASL